MLTIVPAEELRLTCPSYQSSIVVTFAVIDYSVLLSCFERVVRCATRLIRGTKHSETWLFHQDPEALSNLCVVSWPLPLPAIETGLTGSDVAPFIYNCPLRASPSRTRVTIVHVLALRGRGWSSMETLRCPDMVCLRQRN